MANSALSFFTEPLVPEELATYVVERGRQPQEPMPTANPSDNPPFAAPSPGYAGAWGGERDWKNIKYVRSFILGLTPQATAISPAPRASRLVSKPNRGGWPPRATV